MIALLFEDMLAREVEENFQSLIKHRLVPIERQGDEEWLHAAHFQKNESQREHVGFEWVVFASVV